MTAFKVQEEHKIFEHQKLCPEWLYVMQFMEWLLELSFLFEKAQKREKEQRGERERTERERKNSDLCKLFRDGAESRRPKLLLQTRLG